MTQDDPQQPFSYEDTMARGASQSQCRDWRDVGRIQGRLQQEREILRRFLSIRFGDLPKGVLRQIAAGTMEDCDRWSERLFHARTIDAIFPDHE